jgi:hypothetical protein
MSILYSTLGLIMIVVISVSVAALVVSLRKWKESVGFYQDSRVRLPRPHERVVISSTVLFLLTAVIC